jgi:hypothetical protein
MVRVARAYARKTDTPWDRIRFDVVSVLLSDPPAIEHFPGVRISRRSGGPGFGHPLALR